MGYYTGSELKIAQDPGVETMVAISGVPSTSQAPDHVYYVEHFRSASKLRTNDR